MKKNRIFHGIYIFLLFLLTVGTVFGLNSSNQQIKEKTNSEIFQYYYHELDYLALSLAQQVDENYEMLSFDENVSSEKREEITALLTNEIKQIENRTKKDPCFSYKAVNTNTQQQVEHLFKEAKNTEILDNVVYSFSSYEYENVSDNYTIFNNLEDYTFYFLGNLYEYEMEGVHINKPENIEITFNIHSIDSTRNHFFVSHSSMSYYNSITSLILLIGAFVLAIFFLFYPIKIVQESQPFKTMKHWKFGVNVAWISFAIVSGVMLCMMFTYFICSGKLSETISEIWNITVSSEVMMVILSFPYLMTFIFISFVFFLMKYIITGGFVRYVKEDTLIGTIISWMKRKMDEITSIDLANPIQKEMIKLIVVNATMMILFIIIFPIGWLFAFLYSIAAYLWLKKKLFKIQSDYESLLDSSRELANGNFEIMDKDVGIFNSLKVELSHVKDGFEKAVEEEVKSSSMKTELISNVSHDLKTPLTCIKNYIILLQDDNLEDAARREYLSNLSQYSDRLQTLIEDLFDISKVNSGNIQLNLMPLNIVSMIEQIRIEYEEMLNSKNLEVISSYSSKELVLNLDGDKTYRIFENLFTNIGKYAMPNSRVYVDVSETENEIKIELKNISELAMNFTAEEIVERFVRGDKSRHETGSGIGLAIAKSFTEIQKGEFHICIDGDLFKVTILFSKDIQVDQKDGSKIDFE